jgi:hypothetical protein
VQQKAAELVAAQAQTAQAAAGATNATPAGEAPPPAPAEAPKAKRKPKTPIADVEATQGGPTTPPTGSAPTTDSVLRVFVGAIPNGPYTLLDGYIAAAKGKLESAFDAPEIRCAPERDKNGQKNPLAFGQWKGALHALIRSEPPAPGTYVLLPSGSEVEAVVVEALVAPCRARGAPHAPRGSRARFAGRVRPLRRAVR